MANNLDIRIKTSFMPDSTALDAFIKQLQSKDIKLNVTIDDAVLKKISNIKIQSPKVENDNITPFYKGILDLIDKYKSKLIDVSEFQRQLSSRIYSKGTGNTNAYFNKEDTATQTRILEQLTQAQEKLNQARNVKSNSQYDRLTSLLKEELDLQGKITQATNNNLTGLASELQKQLEINKAKQQQVNSTIKNGNLFNAEREAQLLTNAYKQQEQVRLKAIELAEKERQKEQQLKEERIKNSRTTNEKNLEAYYQNASKYIEQYNRQLITATELQKKLKEVMFNGGKPTWQLEALPKNQQDSIYRAYNNVNAKVEGEIAQKQTVAYTELNKLLVQRYNLLQQINKATLSRYEAKGDSVEEQRVTVLERELRARLALNTQQTSQVNNTIQSGNLQSQERVNQLLERETALRGQLRTTIAQTNATMNMQNGKAKNDLEMFNRSMEVQMRALADRYQLVGGSGETIQRYRDLLRGVTVENGRWVLSTQQADGTMQRQVVTARELRMRYREMNSEIQSSIGIFDRLRINMAKFAQYFFAGGFIVNGIRQVREAFTYINQMDKYMTNVRLITGQTAEEVQGLTQSYIDLGRELGAVSTNVAQIAEEFYRQGKNAQETKSLIETATMVSQLSGTGTKESVQYVTSIMNGFKIGVEDMNNTMSKLVAVDNNASVSLAGLGEAFQKTANTSKLAGIEIDRMAGYLGTVMEVTQQSGDVVGKQYCRYVQKCA